jgi:peptidyl-prolyl cis-trans isomerase SurA
MTLTQLRQRRVASRIKISDQDIENFLNSDLAKTNLAPDYHLSHLLIPVNQRDDKAAQDAAEALANKLYLDLQNGADFAETAVKHSAGQKALEGGDLGWRKAAQLPTIFASIVLDMKKGDVSEPIRSASGFHIIKIVDLRGGSEHIITQTHVRHILIRPNEIRSLPDAKALIDDIQARIIAGKDSFDAMAKTYSDDTGSALEGGDLGWSNPGTMVAEFEKVMTDIDLKTLSAPFQSQYGWHILEVLGRRNQDMSETFRRNQAHNMLQRRKFDEELASWLREIRQNAYVDIRI